MKASRFYILGLFLAIIAIACSAATPTTPPDGEDAADLGHLGLGTEVRDLLLENGGDFRRADVHQRTPLIESSRFCSLVFKDASIMREPTLTTTPPRSAGSTLAESCTGRPA